MGEPRLTVIARPDWGAGPVTVGYPIPHEQVRRLVVHHDVIGFDARRPAVDEAARHARAVARSRPDLGDDWPYSWGLAPDYHDHDHTIIVEGRGWRRTGAHTKDHNSTAYGVVLFGDYMTMIPTRGQVRGLRLLGRWLADPEGADETLWHKRLARTLCPGDNGIAVAALGQPPFSHTDLAVFYPEAPMPDVTGRHNPPTPPAAFVDSLDAPDGGAWALTADGGVYTFGSAPFFGAPAGKAYFVGMRAAKLIPLTDTKGRHRYLVRNSAGQDYGHDGF